MSYDQSFFLKYTKYLEEPTVRKAHDRMFNLFGTVAWKLPNVIDLGSGSGEFYRYFYKYTIGNYKALDFHNPNNIPNFTQGDYTALDPEHMDSVMAFVSLFSTECCLSTPAKYALYDRLFTEFPELRYGLVAGFYYEGRKTAEQVSETGNLVSYQSIEDPKEWVRDNYIEHRTYMRVPSKLFGKDVVEVWKLFVRR